MHNTYLTVLICVFYLILIRWLVIWVSINFLWYFNKFFHALYLRILSFKSLLPQLALSVSVKQRRIRDLEREVSQLEGELEAQEQLCKTRGTDLEKVKEELNQLRRVLDDLKPQAERCVLHNSRKEEDFCDCQGLLYHRRANLIFCVVGLR